MEPQDLREKCRNWLAGCCKRGDKCKFVHVGPSGSSKLSLRSIALAEKARSMNDTALLQQQLAVERLSQQSFLQQGAMSSQPSISQQGAASSQQGFLQKDAVSSQQGFLQQGAVSSQQGFLQQGAVSTQPSILQQGAVSSQQGFLQPGAASNQQGFLQQGAVSNQQGFLQQGAVSTHQGFLQQGAVSNQQGFLQQGAVSTQQGFLQQGAVSTQQIAVSNQQSAVSNQLGFLQQGVSSNQQSLLQQGQVSGGAGLLGPIPMTLMNPSSLSLLQQQQFQQQQLQQRQLQQQQLQEQQQMLEMQQLRLLHQQKLLASQDVAGLQVNMDMAPRNLQAIQHQNLLQSQMSSLPGNSSDLNSVADGMQTFEKDKKRKSRFHNSNEVLLPSLDVAKVGVGNPGSREGLQEASPALMQSVGRTRLGHPAVDINHYQMMPLTIGASTFKSSQQQAPFSQTGQVVPNSPMLAATQMQYSTSTGMHISTATHMHVPAGPQLPVPPQTVMSPDAQLQMATASQMQLASSQIGMLRSVDQRPLSSSDQMSSTSQLRPQSSSSQSSSTGISTEVKRCKFDSVNAFSSSQISFPQKQNVQNTDSETITEDCQPSAEVEYQPEDPTDVDDDYIDDFVEKLMSGSKPKIIQPDDNKKKKGITIKDMSIPKKKPHVSLVPGNDVGYQDESYFQRKDENSRKDHVYRDEERNSRNERNRDQERTYHESFKDPSSEEMTLSDRQQHKDASRSRTYRDEEKDLSFGTDRDRRGRSSKDPSSEKMTLSDRQQHKDASQSNSYNDEEKNLSSGTDRHRDRRGRGFLESDSSEKMRSQSDNRQSKHRSRSRSNHDNERSRSSRTDRHRDRHDSRERRFQDSSSSEKMRSCSDNQQSRDRNRRRNNHNDERSGSFEADTDIYKRRERRFQDSSSSEKMKSFSDNHQNRDTSRKRTNHNDERSGSFEADTDIYDRRERFQGSTSSEKMRSFSDNHQSRDTRSKRNNQNDERSCSFDTDIYDRRERNFQASSSRQKYSEDFETDQPNRNISMRDEDIGNLQELNHPEPRGRDQNVNISDRQTFFNYRNQTLPTFSESNRQVASDFSRRREMKEDNVGPVPAREVHYGSDLPVSIAMFMKSRGKYKEGLEAMTKNFKLPGNCIGLTPPKMNANVWEVLKKSRQTCDDILQAMQRWFASGVIPLILQVDYIGKAIQNVQTVGRYTSDSLNVLTYVLSSMNVKRRLVLRNFVPTKLKLLCRRTGPMTPLLLFGDSFPQDLLEMEAGTFKVPTHEKTLLSQLNNDDPWENNFKPMFFPNLAMPGPQVDDSVANIINMACANDGDMSDLRNKYRIPRNCGSLTPPKINPEFLSYIVPFGLEVDNRLQDVHLSIAEGMVPMMTLLQSIHENKYDENEAITLLTDALLLLGNAAYQINKVRMQAMRQSLPEQLRHFCGYVWPGADTVPVDNIANNP